MPIEVEESTQRCTLIGDKLRIEGKGPEIEIVTDEQLRMSVAIRHSARA